MIYRLLMFRMIDWGRVFIFPFLHSYDGGVIVTSLPERCNFPSGSHLKSIRYHFFFYALTLLLLICILLQIY